jgi:hypothetical protein
MRYNGYDAYMAARALIFDIMVRVNIPAKSHRFE